MILLGLAFRLFKTVSKLIRSLVHFFPHYGGKIFIIIIIIIFGLFREVPGGLWKFPG